MAAGTVRDAVRAGERRRQILAAAEACFARRGFHAATMPDICAEAGLSPGTVYRYFRSKDELVEAIVEEDRAESLELLETNAARPDPLAAIFETVDGTLRELGKPGAAALVVEVCAEAARNPRVGEVVRRHDESVFGRLEVVLRRGQALGEIDPDLEPAATARLLAALIDGLLVRKAIAPEFDLNTLAPAIKRAVAAVLQPPDQTGAGR